MKYIIDPLNIVSTLLKQIFKESYKSQITLPPEQMAEMIIEHDPRVPNDPVLHGQITRSLLSGIAFLQSKMPFKPSSLQNDFFGEEWKPAKSDIDRFQEYLQAALHPEKIIKAIKKMTASKVEIQTCKAIYPEAGGEAVQEVLHKVQGKKIPYSKKLWLSNLSDAGLLKSTQGSFIAGIQGTFDINNPAPATESPERSKSPRKKTPQALAGMVASDATDLQKGDDK